MRRGDFCPDHDFTRTPRLHVPTTCVGLSAATRGCFPAYSAVQADAPEIAEYALQMDEEACGEYTVDDAVVP